MGSEKRFGCCQDPPISGLSLARACRFTLVPLPQPLPITRAKVVVCTDVANGDEITGGLMLEHYTVREPRPTMITGLISRVIAMVSARIELVERCGGLITIGIRDVLIRALVESADTYILRTDHVGWAMHVASGHALRLTDTLAICQVAERQLGKC